MFMLNLITPIRMTNLSYIIWNIDPEAFSIGSLSIRWYGILFGLGFLISQQILAWIFKQEGKPEKDVGTLTIYMLIATVVGARLGHVFFYEPMRYLENPIDIFKIREGGLASHGATIGILLALYIYSKRKKGQSYLWVLDRLVIVIALTGSLIRLGNFMNSEIIGLPSQSSTGVVFARDAVWVLDNDDAVEQVLIEENSSVSADKGYAPIDLTLRFASGDYSKDQLRKYLEQNVQNAFQHHYVAEHLKLPGDAIDYQLSKSEGKWQAKFLVWGIVRYPAQLFESISCILLFGLLLVVWYRKKQHLTHGVLFSIFLVVVFGLRFVYEFYKENQVAFEDGLALNMGQWLSIPLVIFGIGLFFYLTKLKKV